MLTNKDEFELTLPEPDHSLPLLIMEWDSKKEFEKHAKLWNGFLSVKIGKKKKTFTAEEFYNLLKC